MKITRVMFGILVASVLVFAQRPSDPALLIPQNAPELDYAAVAERFPLERLWQELQRALHSTRKVICSC